MRAVLKYSFFAFVLITFFAFSVADVLHHWKIKDDFNIKFTHIDAEGVFKKFEGNISFDEAKPDEAKFDVKVAVNSVQSGNPGRDESIMSDSWLDAENYPHVIFVAEGAKKVEGKWQTTGKLNIRGQENIITIPFDFVQVNADSAVFNSSFTLNMLSFHLSDEPEETLQLDLKVPVKKN